MVKKTSVIILLVMLILQMNVIAEDLYQTDIRQIYCFSDLIRLYVDIEDKNSNFVSKPERSAIAGYIDGTKLTTKETEQFGNTGEGTADVFLVDVSGSIRDNQMQQVKTAIKTWVSQMDGNDRVAVISFGDSVNTLIDFSNDKDAINREVEAINNNANKTQLYGGIEQAIKIASRSDKDIPKRKNIILITDGVNDYSGGIRENDIYSELKNALVPVYCMWMSNSKASNQKGLSTLNSVAQYSGGEMYDMHDKEISTVYGWIRNSIQSTYVIDFAYDGINPDNALHNFNIKVAQDSHIAEDSVDFTLKKNSESSQSYVFTEAESSDSDESDNKKVMLFVFLTVLLLLLIGAGITVFVFNRKKTEAQQRSNIGEYKINTAITNDFTKRTAPVIQAQIPQGRKIKFVPTGFGAVSEITFNSRMTIGRNPMNTLVLKSPKVSGKHACITEENGNLYLEDAGSVNSTLLNGCIVRGKMKLNSGDIVIFGDSSYRVSF